MRQDRTYWLVALVGRPLKVGGVSKKPKLPIPSSKSFSDNPIGNVRYFVADVFCDFWGIASEAYVRFNEEHSNDETIQILRRKVKKIAQENNLPFYEITAFGLFTLENQLLCVDIDEGGDIFRQQYPALFESTAVVKSRRGYHVYFSIPEGFDINQITGGRKDWVKQTEEGRVKIEIRAGKRMYMVAPGSRIITEDGREFVYEPFNKVEPVVLDAELLKKIIGWFDNQNGKTIVNMNFSHPPTVKNYENPPVMIVTGKTKNLSEAVVDAIVDVVGPIYQEGHRQDIVMFLAGEFWKRSIHPRWAYVLVDKLVSKTGDPEKNNRYTAIEYTYQKNPSEVKGLSGFSEIGFEPQRLAVKKILATVDRAYREKTPLENYHWNGIASVYLSNGNGKKTKSQTNPPAEVVEYFEEHPDELFYELPTGTRRSPAPEVWKYDEDENGNPIYKLIVKGGYLDKLVSSPTNSYWWAYVSGEGWVKISEIDEFRRKTAVVDKLAFQDYTEWKRLKGYVQYMGAVGWNERNGEVVWVSGDDPYTYWERPWIFKPSDRQKYDKHLELFVNYLKKPGITSTMLILGFTSYLLWNPMTEKYDRFQNPIFINLIGKTGSGKTTMAKMVYSLWTGTSNISTSNTTTVGLELASSRCGNTIYVADETTVAIEDRMKEIVYYMSTGQGRTRGTKKLGVSVTQIRSNFLFTGETDSLKAFREQGLSRRVLTVPLMDRLEYPYQELFSFWVELGGFYQTLAENLNKWLGDERNLDAVAREVEACFDNKYGNLRRDYLERQVAWIFALYKIYLTEKGFVINWDEIWSFIVNHILAPHSEEFHERTDPETVIRNAIESVISSSRHNFEIRVESLKDKKVYRLEKAKDVDTWVYTFVSEGSLQNIYIRSGTVRQFLATYNISPSDWEEAKKRGYIMERTTRSTSQTGVLQVYPVNMEWWHEQQGYNYKLQGIKKDVIETEDFVVDGGLIQTKQEEAKKNNIAQDIVETTAPSVDEIREDRTNLVGDAYEPEEISENLKEYLKGVSIKFSELDINGDEGGYNENEHKE